MRFLTFKDFAYDPARKDWWYSDNNVLIGFRISNTAIFRHLFIFACAYHIDVLVFQGSKGFRHEMFCITPEAFRINRLDYVPFMVLLPEVAKLILVSGNIQDAVIDLHTIEIMLLLGLGDEYFRRVIDNWIDWSIPIPMLDGELEHDECNH